jgi:hypothetical protein
MRRTPGQESGLDRSGAGAKRRGRSDAVATDAEALQAVKAVSADVRPGTTILSVLIRPNGSTRPRIRNTIVVSIVSKECPC